MTQIEQADREAAAKWAKSNSRHQQAANIKRGSCDTAPLVQAFAAHAAPLRATIARLTAELEATKWQPIETAPKDGTIVLFSSTSPRWRYPFPALWDVGHECWIFADRPLNYIWGISELVDVWRPLPTAPAKGQDDE
jgi:hypothetical protein